MSDEEERHALLAIETREPVAIDDAFTDKRGNREHLRRHQVRSVLVVPLGYAGRTFGVMFFNHHVRKHTFGPRELDFARQLGVTASIAIQNSHQFAQRKEAEAALRASEARLGLLSRTASELLRAEDPQRVIPRDRGLQRSTGLAKARELVPTVILCDIGLPGMDGYEVARAIKSDPALDGVLLVALSGYALPEDLQRAQEAGFDAHIAKPPSLERIRELFAGLARPAEPDARIEHSTAPEGSPGQLIA